MDSSPQLKPTKRLNYAERCKLGLVKSKPRAAMKKASKPMRKVSKKQQPILAEYSRWIKVALPEVSSCARCKKSGVGLEPHHPMGRSGQNLFCVIGLCHDCHEWVHGSPNSALAEGWLQPEYRGLKSDPSYPKPWIPIPKRRLHPVCSPPVSDCATKDHCAEIGGCENGLTMVGDVEITASRYWCDFCGKFGDHQSGCCPAPGGSQSFTGDATASKKGANL